MSPDELNTRLRSVELSLATLTQLVQDQLATLTEFTRKHELILLGNRAEQPDAIGLVADVDSLRASQRRLIWGLKGLGAAAFTVLGAAAAHYLGF